MKKNLKIVILVLSVALLVGAFALAVSAADGNVAKVEGGSEYATLKEALDAVPEGGKITLTDDAALTESYTVTKGFTLDIGDYTLDLVTDAFVMNSAKSVTITGNGTMNLAGTLVKSTATAGVAYTFTVKGVEEGIDILHGGTGDAKRIVFTKGGTNVFENVEVLSTSTCDGKLGDAFHADNSSVATELTFNKFTYRNNNYATLQNSLGFLWLGGGSKATITDSAIYSAGTIVDLDNNTNKDPNTVLLDVTNSHLELITTYSKVRNQLIYAGTANNPEAYGTVKFKDSYLGGNCYRALYGDQKSSAAFYVIFDHSVLVNGGASGNTDAILTRGITIKAINNSCIASNGSGLVMGEGALKCEIGTRFNFKTAINSSNITWMDTNGATITNVSKILDPIGNSAFPFVGAADASAAYTFPGVTAVDVTSFTSILGNAATSATNVLHGLQTDNVGSAVWGDLSDAYEGFSKAGSIVRYTAGNNSCFKYYVNPTAAAPNYGDTRKFSTDAYFIFGDNASYSNAMAQIANTKVYVLDFDIATDSDYGFTPASLKITSRSNEKV